MLLYLVVQLGFLITQWDESTQFLRHVQQNEVCGARQYHLQIPLIQALVRYDNINYGPLQHVRISHYLCVRFIR